MNEYDDSVVVIQTYITQRIKETFTHTLSYLLTTLHLTPLTPLKPQIIYRVFDHGVL